MKFRKEISAWVLTHTVSASILLAAAGQAETMKPVVMGKRGVVAAGHPPVAEAGLRILHKGGNAVDAGVTTVIAAAAVEMNGFGLGGECPLPAKPFEGGRPGRREMAG